LKVRPKDKEGYALVAEATMNLRKYQRCAECLEEIYGMEPTPSLAREIHVAYQQAENMTKQLEWADRLFKKPEFDADYMLRYEYVMKFLNNNNLPKAAEYGHLALKSANLAEHRDKQMEVQWRKVRRASYHVIASNLRENGNFIAAISAFKQAIKVERYGQGYYEIAVCLENQKNVEEAMIYYAVAETMSEENALKAKARLEILYKALHNDTLIGIDKVYKKASEIFAAPDKSG
jgi:tetratricopeptide (TPR) repeat protein